jgi:hypothetical protein
MLAQIVGFSLDRTTPARMFAQATVLTVAARACRVARSTLTLLRAGHVEDARALGRSLFDCWISAMYFVAFPRRAALYGAYQPFKQESELRKIIAGSTTVSISIQDVLDSALSNQVRSRKYFTDLWTRKKKQRTELLRVPLDADAMRARIVPMLIRETVFPKDVTTASAKKNYVTEKLHHAYWSWSKGASQEPHHTPLTLSTTLDIGSEGTIRGLYTKTGTTADALALICCSTLIWVLIVLGRFLERDLGSQIDIFQEALTINRQRIGIMTSIDDLIADGARLRVGRSGHTRRARKLYFSMVTLLDDAHRVLTRRFKYAKGTWAGGSEFAYGKGDTIRSEHRRNAARRSPMRVATKCD